MIDYHFYSQDLRSDEHYSVATDVSQSDSVSECFQKVLEKYKRPPDIIVNSAGITKDGFLLRMKEEDFDQVIDVNLKGTFLVTQVGYQASSLLLQLKYFNVTGSGQSDEGESVAGIHRQHRQHCSEDWKHRPGQLHRQQGGGDRLHQNCC